MVCYRWLLFVCPGRGKSDLRSEHVYSVQHTESVMLFSIEDTILHCILLEDNYLFAHKLMFKISLTFKSQRGGLCPQKKKSASQIIIYTIVL